MRRLMWFSIGFSAACVLGVYVFSTAALFLMGAACLLLSGLLFLLNKQGWGRVAAILCLGLAVGQAWYGVYDLTHLKPGREVDGQTVTVSLEATDFSYDTDYGIAFDAVVEISGRDYGARVYLNQKEQLSPGDTVEGQFRLRYTAPGGLEEATYHSGSGMLLLAYPRGEEHTVTKAETVAWKYRAAHLRAYLLELLGTIFPEDARPFVKALLMGDTSELNYESDTDLSVSGIRHVAAVSGLHVSILFSMVYLFAGRRRGLSALIGIPVLILFAAMAGFSASIVRAAIMQGLMLLALTFDREYDPPTALAFAALAMLAVNPLTITSVGFQLSVASVAGIFLFSGRISGWLLDPKRLGRWKGKNLKTKLSHSFASSVSISLSTLITTTPLTACYFGTVSLLSAVTNLLCLWVVTILFCGIIVACVLSLIWMPLGSLAAWCLSWLVRYILGVAKVVAGIPLSAVYTQSVYIVIWIVFCYILLAVFLLGKQKRPVVLSCCVVLTLCIALLASWAEPMLDHYRVTVLDVGQGQCVLLQSQGRTYMVDCGGDYDEGTADTAAAMLLSQGITRLDGLILSHYDKDHVNGAGYLLYRIPTDVLILPQGEESEQWDTAILAHHAGTTVRADRDLEITWGQARIRIYSSINTKTSNESSLCVLFQTEKCDILITGDRSQSGEALLLAAADIPKLDALVVGHHGSSSSTGELLLKATQPAQALISVGEGNAYDHPSQKVLDRLTTYGCVIRRTDLEGTIILRG